MCAISACGVVLDEAAPRAPTGLTAAPGDGRVVLRWSRNTEPDVFYSRPTARRQRAGRTALPSTVLSPPLAGALHPSSIPVACVVE